MSLCRRLIRIFWVGVFICGPLADAADSPKLPRDVRTIRKGTPITVESYNLKTNSFLILLNKTPDSGPNFASPDDLHRALGMDGDLKSFARQSKQSIGTIYTLQNDLPVLSDDEQYSRAKINWLNPSAKSPGEEATGKAETTRENGTTISPGTSDSVATSSTTSTTTTSLEAPLTETEKAEEEALRQQRRQAAMVAGMGFMQALQSSGGAYNMGNNQLDFQRFETGTHPQYKGSVEACGSVPGQVMRAKSEAVQFRATCPSARPANSSGKIVINDYSSLSSPPYLYIFDAAGNCEMKTAVSWGNGYGRASARPLPCGANKSHLTPPGMHITGPHHGEDYKSYNSLLLLGLEGQTPQSRAILIHTARSVGGPYSHGCTGVASNVYPTVHQKIGSGSLVYNYFGNTGLAAGCSTNAGMNPSRPICTSPGAIGGKGTLRQSVPPAAGARQ